MIFESLFWVCEGGTFNRLLTCLLKAVFGEGWWMVTGSFDRLTGLSTNDLQLWLLLCTKFQLHPATRIIFTSQAVNVKEIFFVYWVKPPNQMIRESTQWVKKKLTDEREEMKQNKSKAGIKQREAEGEVGGGSGREAKRERDGWTQLSPYFPSQRRTSFKAESRKREGK